MTSAILPCIVLRELEVLVSLKCNSSHADDKQHFTCENDLTISSSGVENDAPQKICEKKEAKFYSQGSLSLHHRYPLHDSTNLLHGHVIDIREQEKEKLRKSLTKSKNGFFGDNIKRNKKEMVRYGEYSPRNPNIVSPDKPLLALGEYEEKRRQLLEQKKREYRQQMAQARINLNTPRRVVHDDDPSQVDKDSLSNVNDTEPVASVTGSQNCTISTTSTQTDNFEEELQSEVTSIHSDAPRSEFGDGFAPDVSDSGQRTGGVYNPYGSNQPPLSPLTLTVPDDISIRGARFQSISPRERKLADLRGSESCYSPSFYEGRTNREGVQDSGSRSLHVLQPSDQVPDIKLRCQLYQEELKQQIEEKRRLDALQKEKEKKEDEVIMRRVEQQQERMRREYEQEKAQRQNRQEQRLQLAKQFQRRQEELKLEAQQEREEEMQRKRGIYNTDSKETEMNQNNNSIPNYNNLSNSFPVPALRTKLLSQADNFYQSPKEVTEILSGHYPKNSVHQQTLNGLLMPAYQTSTKPDEVNNPKPFVHQSKRYSSLGLMNKARTGVNVEHSLDPEVRVRDTRSELTKSELFHHSNMDEIPISTVRNSSPNLPVIKTAGLEQQTSCSEPIYAHADVQREVPLGQKNILRTSDVISEARPTNILTQLGAFRRQMQIDQIKMEEQLQKTLQKKRSV